MDNCIITPKRLKNDPRLPATGLLLINPAEADYGIKHAIQLGGKRHAIFNSKLAVFTNETSGFFVAGPSVGAPMAVMTLEKLIALGAQNIIVYSWCGSLQEHIKIADIFLPTWGYSEEGTSAHYPIKEEPAATPELRNEIVAFLETKGLVPQQGPIWTTDAPFRETRQKVEKLQKQGIAAVDMEYTALNTVSTFRNVNLDAVMLFSDELWRAKWSPGFTKKSFRQKSHAIIELLVDFCLKKEA